jgi:hypothetical protein
MLVAIPVGLVVGLLAGGHAEALTLVRFRWAWLAIAGLVVQVGLFTPQGHALAGDLAGPVYVGSTAAVLVAVLINLRLEWMPVVALGAAANLAAIVANGGAMPTTAEALATAGLDGPGIATNSVVLAHPALAPFTDIYAVPAWIPLANVFSIGDALVAVGVAGVIAAAMRGGSDGDRRADTDPDLGA